MLIRKFLQPIINPVIALGLFACLFAVPVTTHAAGTDPLYRITQTRPIYGGLTGPGVEYTVHLAMMPKNIKSIKVSAANSAGIFGSPCSDLTATDIKKIGAAKYSLKFRYSGSPYLNPCEPTGQLRIKYYVTNALIGGSTNTVRATTGTEAELESNSENIVAAIESDVHISDFNEFYRKIDFTSSITANPDYGYLVSRQYKGKKYEIGRVYQGYPIYDPINTKEQNYTYHFQLISGTGVEHYDTTNQPANLYDVFTQERDFTCYNRAPGYNDQTCRILGSTVIDDYEFTKTFHPSWYELWTNNRDLILNSSTTKPPRHLRADAIPARSIGEYDFFKDIYVDGNYIFSTVNVSNGWRIRGKVGFNLDLTSNSTITIGANSTIDYSGTSYNTTGDALAGTQQFGGYLPSGVGGGGGGHGGAGANNAQGGVASDHDPHPNPSLAGGAGGWRIQFYDPVFSFMPDYVRSAAFGANYRPEVYDTGGSNNSPFYLASTQATGGGVLKLKAANSVTNQGEILANGTEGFGAWTYNGVGGGAGGTVKIEAPTITNSSPGIIAAKGNYGSPAVSDGTGFYGSIGYHHSEGPGANGGGGTIALVGNYVDNRARNEQRRSDSAVYKVGNGAVDASAPPTGRQGFAPNNRGEDGWINLGSAAAGNISAVDDSAQVNEGSSVSIPILNNDQEADNSALVKSSVNITIEANPQVGSVSNHNDGSGNITYTANANIPNNITADQLTYKICRKTEPANCDTANVLISIAQQVAPTAVDDFIVISQGSYTLINPMRNDINPVSISSIAITDQTQVTHGTLVVELDEVGNPAYGDLHYLAYSLRYTPDPNYFGNDDWFRYRICNNANQCSEANVYLNVIEFIDPRPQLTLENCENHNPVHSDRPYVTFKSNRAAGVTYRLFRYEQGEDEEDEVLIKTYSGAQAENIIEDFFNVSSGVTYYYYIKSSGNNGYTSQTVSITARNCSSVPSGGSGESFCSGSVPTNVPSLPRNQLNWVDAGASSYQIYRDGSFLANSDSNSYVDELVRTNQTYTYLILTPSFANPIAVISVETTNCFDFSARIESIPPGNYSLERGEERQFQVFCTDNLGMEICSP